MNLEDLAKKTIDELSTQIDEKKDELKKQNEAQEDGLKEEFLEQGLEDIGYEDEAQELSFNPYEEELKLNETANPSLNEEDLSSFKDELFLKNVRERILVLFEGLNATKKEDLEKRLDLSISFLEFLLANIEDKLKK